MGIVDRFKNLFGIGSGSGDEARRREASEQDARDAIARARFASAGATLTEKDNSPPDHQFPTREDVINNIKEAWQIVKISPEKVDFGAMYELYSRITPNTSSMPTEADLKPYGINRAEFMTALQKNAENALPVFKSLLADDDSDGNRLGAVRSEMLVTALIAAHKPLNDETFREYTGHTAKDFVDKTRRAARKGFNEEEYAAFERNMSVIPGVRAENSGKGIVESSASRPPSNTGAQVRIQTDGVHTSVSINGDTHFYTNQHDETPPAGAGKPHVISAEVTGGPFAADGLNRKDLKDSLPPAVIKRLQDIAQHGGALVMQEVGNLYAPSTPSQGARKQR